MMNTIPAREIKRRGITAVDEALKQGPVHIIRNDEPRYVVLTEEHYRDLVDDAEDGYQARLRASLKDVAAGRVQKFRSVSDLMAAIDAADEA